MTVRIVCSRPISWHVVLLGLALVAAACDGRGTKVPPPVGDSEPRRDLDRKPEVFDAAALDTVFPIKHVVFLIKENRTFDHMFGTFPSANGVSLGMESGQPRTLVRGTDGRLPDDIPHCYPCAIAAWNEGTMDAPEVDGFGFGIRCP